jgi:hypothetical protein
MKQFKKTNRNSISLILEYSSSFGTTALFGPGSPISSGYYITYNNIGITVIRTPLDEGLNLHRCLYLTTHNTHERQTSMAELGFKPAIPTNDRPQILP